MDEYVKREDAYQAAGLIALASVDHEITCGKVKQIMDNIPAANVVKLRSCNTCEYYEGVHHVSGHAPCSFWKIGCVMWNDFCSRWEEENV